MRKHLVSPHLPGLVALCLLCGLVVAEPAFARKYYNSWQPELSRETIALCTGKLKQLQQKARAGNAEAQVDLGWCYDVGIGVPKDDNKAVELYRRAAEQGNMTGVWALGTMYQNGEGVPKDDRRAVELYRQAAERGNADGQNALAWMYWNGRGGLPKDEKRAMELFGKATAQGYVPAMHMMALRYIDGRGGVRQNSKRAGELAVQCAEQGYAGCQTLMGVLYSTPKLPFTFVPEFPVDLQLALKWLHRAAAQGDKEAAEEIPKVMAKIARERDLEEHRPCDRRCYREQDDCERARSCRDIRDVGPRVDCLNACWRIQEACRADCRR